MELESEIDWERLGGLYCWGGGGEFFGPAQVEAIREAGLLITSALAERLQSLPPGAGRSLYLGAAVAELTPMLCESLVLGREIVAVSLPGDESAELNRALATTERNTGIEMPRITVDGIDRVDGVFDHGWMVSVVNDPEAFPALHDELYQRKNELATGRGDTAIDRERATLLAQSLLERLAPEAILTTTDEELPLLTPLVEACGWKLEPAEEALLSAVVGDPLRFCRLRERT